MRLICRQAAARRTREGAYESSGSREIIGKGLERITANGEEAEAVFKDVADQLNTEKQPVLRALKDLGEA